MLMENSFSLFEWFARFIGKEIITNNMIMYKFSASCGNGNIEMVKYIINSDKNNILREHYSDGLWQACTNSKYNIIELLMFNMKPSRKEITDGNFRSKLDMICSYANPKTLEIIDKGFRLRKKDYCLNNNRAFWYSLECRNLNAAIWIMNRLKYSTEHYTINTNIIYNLQVIHNSRENCDCTIWAIKKLKILEKDIPKDVKECVICNKKMNEYTEL